LPLLAATGFFPLVLVKAGMGEFMIQDLGLMIKR
jgi:hypothetical protein